MILSRILTPLFGLFTAEFPDDAALAEFAVEAGVGAGPAIIQALLAVADLHFLADHAGVPLRVVAAFIHKFHRDIIAKIVTLDQPGEKFTIGFSYVVPRTINEWGGRIYMVRKTHPTAGSDQSAVREPWPHLEIMKSLPPSPRPSPPWGE
jgi:hypothetical protein